MNIKNTSRKEKSIHCLILSQQAISVNLIMVLYTLDLIQNLKVRGLDQEYPRVGHNSLKIQDLTLEVSYAKTSLQRTINYRPRRIYLNQVKYLDP